MKNWKRLTEFMVFKIKAEKIKKADLNSFTHTLFFRLQNKHTAVSQKPRRHCVCSTSVYFCDIFASVRVSPLADDLSVGFHQVVGDVSSRQVLQCVGGAQLHLNNKSFL